MQIFSLEKIVLNIGLLVLIKPCVKQKAKSRSGDLGR